MLSSHAKCDIFQGLRISKTFCKGYAFLKHQKFIIYSLTHSKVEKRINKVTFMFFHVFCIKAKAVFVFLEYNAA